MTKEQQKVDDLVKERADLLKKIQEHAGHIVALGDRCREIIEANWSVGEVGELPDAREALMLSKCPVYNDRYRIKAVDDKTWVELITKYRCSDSYFFKKETGILKNARKDNLSDINKVDINKVMEIWNDAQTGSQ